MSDVGEVLAALERALLAWSDDARPMLVLDADGTLWTGDVGLDLFTRALAEGAFKEVARDALAAEARANGVTLDAAASATEAARALLEAHDRGAYAHGPAYAMMAWAFAGFSEIELLAFAERVAEEVSVERRLIAETREVVTWAQRRGVSVTLCSASPKVIVDVGARLFDLTPEDVIAVTPCVRDGVLLPALIDGPLPYGEGKVARLRSERPRHALLGAFGDSAADVHFLRLARVPVAVQPAPALRALIPELPRAFVL